MDNVDALIDSLLADNDTESEFGRVRAYRQLVRYAEEHLAGERDGNLFLIRAAERLGQAPLAMEVVHNRVPLSEQARLSFYYHEDEGPVLVGNQPGLRYLGELLSELAEAPVPGENVVLFEDAPPWVGDSYGLTVYVEDEAWFDAFAEGLEDQFVAEWEAELNGRILHSESIVAIQLVGPIPQKVALTPQKLYRVQALEPWTAGERDVVSKPYRSETESVRVVSLIDDEGQPVRLALDLEDPEVAFYYAWHLEQFGVKGEGGP